MERFKIRTINDVNSFLQYVMTERGLGWEFHPDNDFTAYGKPDADEPLFTDDEAEVLNTAIEDCFTMCEKMHKDIYKLTLDYQINHCPS